MVPARAAPGQLPEVSRAVVGQYAKTAYAVYEDCLKGATALRSAVRALVESPSAENLAAARRAWTKARQPYLQSEVLRYYAGPIDDADEARSRMR